MAVIVLCEESQEVTKALRQENIAAYSCDIKQCTGNHPEWHIQAAAEEVLYSESWSGIIAHPPCTRLARSAFPFIKRNGLEHEVFEAAKLFKLIWNYALESKTPCCIENSIPNTIAKSLLPKHTQTVQPWQYGNTEQKSTVLWLHLLPPLLPTEIASFKTFKLLNIGECKNRSTLRSKTFPEIARAMATQWKSFFLEKEQRNNYK